MPRDASFSESYLRLIAVVFPVWGSDAVHRIAFATALTNEEVVRQDEEVNCA